MHERPVLSEIEVPVVSLHWQPFLLDPRQQLVVIVLALRAANDLTVALGSKQIIAKDGARVGRILLHVERLGLFRIVVDEDGAVLTLDENRFVFSAQVVAPLHGTALLLESLYRVAVVDAWKRRLDFLEFRNIALELLELGLAALEHAGNDIGDEILLEPHVVVGVVEGYLWLDHPEFSQVPARFRFFGPKRRAETVDLSQRGRCRLSVQLAGLRQEGCSLIEVFGSE